MLNLAAFHRKQHCWQKSKTTSSIKEIAKLLNIPIEQLLIAAYLITQYSWPFDQAFNANLQNSRENYSVVIRQIKHFFWNRTSGPDVNQFILGLDT